MLSLSNNRLEDIYAVTSLRSLRILRVDRNRIVRLPASLSSLRDLTILDVAHNRLEAVPPALADLAARLYRYIHVNIHLHNQSINSALPDLLLPNPVEPNLTGFQIVNQANSVIL